MDANGPLYAALLGLALAASTGLNAFLPLLMLSVAAHFGLHGITLTRSFAWLASDTAMIALAVAAVIHVVTDKIPVLDHALHVAGALIRPVAGTLAAAAVFHNTDPTTAALAGFIIGAPTALGVHSVKASARVASSTMTAGLANPLLSLLEDGFALLIVMIGFLAPLLVPFILAACGWGLWSLLNWCRLKFRRS